MGPDLLRAFAWGWSAHLLLGEQPFPQRATRESSHRLKVSIALRTPSEYGEFDGCTPLNSVSTPLADELDERGHPTTYSGPTERCLHSIAEGRQRGARRPRDAKAASVEAASACPYVSHRPMGSNGWCGGIVASEPPLRPPRPTRDFASCAKSSARYPQRAQSRSKGRRPLAARPVLRRNHGDLG